MWRDSMTQATRAAQVQPVRETPRPPHQHARDVLDGTSTLHAHSGVGDAQVLSFRDCGVPAVTEWSLGLLACRWDAR